MSNPNDTNSNAQPDRPPYAQYQIELYARAIMAGERAPTTTDPAKLEEQARGAMSPQGFGYVFGGAGEQATMHANRLAFRRFKLVPHFLRPTVPRDLNVTLFGRTYDSPVLMAPVGVQKAYHADGEMGVASACADLGVPFVYSTASSTPIEDVAAAADKAFAESDRYSGGAGRAPRWFQLYRPRDDGITRSLLDRAKRAGCDALVVTLDTFTLSWRPADLDHGFLPFLEGQGCQLGLSDPAFRERFEAESGGAKVEDDVVAASRAWIGEVFSGEAHRWEDLGRLREMWGDGPILLKGVCSVEDAVKAKEYGMDGVVVSNHGGRQLDGAVASLEVLPEIVDAVGKEMTVLFDSGIRTGTDIMKALALGAQAVFVGRPVIYGLGIAGQKGARHVLAGLLADFDQSMGLAGIKSVKELNRALLRRTNYGGDLKSVL